MNALVTLTRPEHDVRRVLSDLADMNALMSFTSEREKPCNSGISMIQTPCMDSTISCRLWTLPDSSPNQPFASASINVDLRWPCGLSRQNHLDQQHTPNLQTRATNACSARRQPNSALSRSDLVQGLLAAVRCGMNQGPLCGCGFNGPSRDFSC
jgi:hypothetical protein